MNNHVKNHPARITIDTAAVEHNMRTLVSYAPDAIMCAVVKGNAYGHGYQVIIPPALAGGASWLGVAQLDEALDIRQWLDDNNYSRPTGKGSPTAPRMLAWIYAPGAAVEDAISADIDLSVSAPWAVEQMAAAARRVGRPARLHAKIDTGLHRSGSTVEDFADLVASIKTAVDAGDIEFVGLWSHFSSADDDDEHSQKKTASQIEVFHQAENICAKAGLVPQIRHMSASSGILFHPEAHFDMVRAGIALYGYSPNESLRTFTSLGLRPVMTLSARIITVKRVAAGAEVSYNGTWQAPTDRWLAVVPLGYADGIPRLVQDGGCVAVAGQRYPIVGRICMDQFVIDLGQADGDTPPVTVGTTAILFGPGTRGEPTAVDWARWEQTIPYEVTTRLGARIPRTAALRLSGLA